MAIALRLFTYNVSLHPRCERSVHHLKMYQVPSSLYVRAVTIPSRGLRLSERPKPARSRLWGLATLRIPLFKCT